MNVKLNRGRSIVFQQVCGRALVSTIRADDRIFRFSDSGFGRTLVMNERSTTDGTSTKLFTAVDMTMRQGNVVVELVFVNLVALDEIAKSLLARFSWRS